MRIEIRFIDSMLDGRASSLAERLTRRVGSNLTLRIVDVVIPGAPLSADRARSVFMDPVVQTLHADAAAAEDADLAGWTALVEVAWRPGVTDTLAITAREALLQLAEAEPAVIAAAEGLATARQFLLYGKLDEAALQRTVKLLHNPLVQAATVIRAAEWQTGMRPPALYPAPAVHDKPEPELIALAGLDDAALEALSTTRLLALTLPEMQALRAYFADPAVQAARQAAGLSVAATDVELEMIAQTWSEHCKHKIFNATIDYVDQTNPAANRTVRSLYKSCIKQTTEDLRPTRPFLRSVFTDNAGVVAFHEGSVLCVKAETHNSPSALDPYGGAITGIVGVNRDILGTGIGAKPIFNTNVLCFGYPDTVEGELPKGLMHPREIMEGVHKGIVDGGNQSGIPTAAGAFLFDESFSGKPLVFCGTGGIMPETVNGKPSWEKEVRPGALAVMLGGRIGKDGIHGATFSSLALDESSPVSAVQIGDPIIQRRMTDFLLEARDLGLYEALTDNGAGGLSSSLGEMAEASGGVRIDLSACPLKYPGLSPWEILVSESQERMSLAVAPECWDEFRALAERRGVEAAIVGEFTNSGYIDIIAHDKPAGLLSLDFLHRGLPAMHIPARWQPVARTDDRPPLRDNYADLLLDLLAEPNVASKEALVRQYDHEVQGKSIEKPFAGRQADAPSDGAVLRVDHTTQRGYSVTHGICPRYSDYDTALMARMAVDEAYRAHIGLGGHPDKAAALDNFCWPDPVESPGTPDGAYKAAQLVRACDGLREACLAYGLPLVSGKDSMKNDARADGKKISVRPTLLVTLLGAVENVQKTVSTDFLDAGDLIYILGDTNGELGCTMLERVARRQAGAQRLRDGMAPTLAGSAAQVAVGDGAAPAAVSPATGAASAPENLPQFGPAPDVDLQKSRELYRVLARAISGRIVRSCHDCSDGGLAVALAESCLGGRLGARLQLSHLPGTLMQYTADQYAVRALFAESGGRFVVSIRKEDRERFEDTLHGHSWRFAGEVSAEPVLRCSVGESLVLETNLAALEQAFKTPIG